MVEHVTKLLVLFNIVIKRILTDKHFAAASPHLCGAAGTTARVSLPVSLPFSLFCSRRWAVGLFFGLLAVLGVALTRDYGMSWDEPAERLNAYVSAKYVALRLAPALAQRQPRLAEIPALAHYPDADHGVLFMLPLVALEALWPGANPAEWAYRRHLLEFWLFGAGAWAVYQLGRARLASWRWGLAGAAILLLSPRLFAEAFYNYKDVVFLSLFALAMLTLARLLRRPTAGRALLHALACAAAIASMNIYRDEKLFENAARLEPIWADAIHSLKGLPNVLDIRTLGLVAGIDLASIPDGVGRRAFNALDHAFQKEGIMIRTTGDTIALTPPLVITENQIDEIVTKVGNTIRAVA